MRVRSRNSFRQYNHTAAAIFAVALMAAARIGFHSQEDGSPRQER